ncbi:hypothetical protein ASF61_07370 [Duganella sp. Leaf126]|uniref:zf-HC2 domain-containing protein n=1 Tax=Duganella sp. Leaf126 TaxID=1736266 RepID=UPI0006FD8478|nr:zf-HC2 domain-containing protein [Duganella sp. Leaf126]KQQ36022.1 hypothetical protein ASF61_07370 [Duganella sp. Leaf126]
MNAGVFNIDGSGPEHRAAQELLPWYAADTLSSDERQRVARHLQHCVVCRRDLAHERALLAAANDDRVAPPDLDMDAALARLLPQLGPQLPAQAEPPQACTQPSGDADTHTRLQPPSRDADMQQGPQQPSGDADTQHGRQQPRGNAETQPLPEAAAPGMPPPAPLRPVLPWWRRAAANEPSWLRWAAAAQCALIVGMAAMLARPDAADTANAPAYHALGNGAAPAGGNLVVMFAPTTTERELRHILQRHGARVVDGPTVTDAYLLRVPDAERQRTLDALRNDPAIRLAEALDESGAP